MTALWNGIEVDSWSYIQTVRPKPKSPSGQWFSGYELLNVQWYDLGIPEMPLSTRYDSFKRRLASALAKRHDK